MYLYLPPLINFQVTPMDTVVVIDDNRMSIIHGLLEESNDGLCGPVPVGECRFYVNHP